MKPSIAFLIFNRPSHTRQVLQEIAKYKPSRLLVVADGPRSLEEQHLCKASRSVIDRVDWDCEVLTDYSEVNLGCRRRVSSGLTWVFQQCEEAIVLEDDCTPNLSFFQYCAEMLRKYREDERVMMIGGSNFQFGRQRGPYSYYFSRYTPVWGWASWRRAWQAYDVDMTLWPLMRGTSWLLDILGDRSAAVYWRAIFDRAFAGGIDTWDYQWTFACWVQNGLVAVPNTNLVSNIGFGEGATHTTAATSMFANLSTTEMPFPLQHPPHMVRDREADMFTYQQNFAPTGSSLYYRLCQRLSAATPDLVRKPLHYLRSKAGGVPFNK